MTDTPSLDTVLHVTQLIIFGGGGVVLYTKMVRFFSKWENVMTEYPPHLHINGNIKYPHGMEPEQLQSLDPNKKG